MATQVLTAGGLTGPASCPRFTIVTVTYRSHQGAAECLDAMLHVARELADDVDWVFVDNSEDSSDARWIRTRGPADNVRVEERPTNPGFAASSNLGAATAATDWVAFVNPDVLVDAASVRHVLESVTGDITGARSFAVGQETAGRRHLGIGMLWGLWFVDRAPSEQSALIGPSGGFAVFHRATFLGSGGFDESLFAWGEDVDLALRLRGQGVTCRPIATFFPHIGGHSVRDDRALHARKVYLLARNRQHVALRHFPLGQLVRFELMVAAVVAAKSVRHARAGSLVAALRGNAVGLGVGLRERARARQGAGPVTTAAGTTPASRDTPGTTGSGDGPDRPAGCSVVVLNWNCATDTVRAVRSLPRSWWPGVVVVDNGSDDWAEQERTLREVPGVLVVRRSRNGGYAAGMNTGMATARERGDRAVALINADALPTAGALRAMFEESERSAVVGISQHVVDRDGVPGDQYVTAAVGRPMTPQPFFCTGCDRGRHDVRVVTGAAIVVELGAMSDLAGIDESFFHYKEEFDLCARARLAGLSVTLLCGDSVGHARGGSLPARSASAYYYSIRNEWLFFRKHRGAVGALLSWRLHRIWTTFAAHAMASGHARAAVQGLAHGARGVHGRRPDDG